MTPYQSIQITNLSLTGRKHRDKGNPCEDASLAVNQNGVYVVCLSDGAGGSQYTHADIGSKCVVETICDLMVRHFDAFFFELHESTVRSVLIAAVQAELAIHSKDLSLPGMESMSSTMLFCAVKDTRMICGHIGDGVIVKVTGSGLQPISLPQNGEDASSTIFMTLPDAQDYLRVIRTTVDDTHAVVLMTDGISDMVFDGTKLLIMPVVARLAELAALSKDECEMQMTQTIKSFIIDASPLSDDASIGIIYLTDTQIPDFGSLPSDKENCIRISGDEMRIVKTEILPRVRIAQSIVAQKNGILDENNKVESENRHSEDTSPAEMAGIDGAANNTENVEDVFEELSENKGLEGIAEDADDESKSVVRTSSGQFIAWRNILLAGSLLVTLIIIGLVLYYYMF